MMPILLMTTLIAQIIPSIGHSLITDPYLERQYDSVMVSSDSITIREKKQNDTTSLKLNQILKPQKRSYEECRENDFSCLYGKDKSNNRIVGKIMEQYSNATDVKNQRNFTDEGNSRKSHWTMIDSQTHQHSHSNTKGWVTLDPVPWSKSKISKWHPSNVASQHETRPWVHDSSAQLPVEQFWMSGSSLHEQKPSSQWGIGTNDIITDSRPGDFPIQPHSGQANPSGMNYPHQEYLYHSQGSLSDYQHQHLKGTKSTNPQNSHPSTYPNNGNGEWVLLSVTKGYSHPPRHRWAGVKDLKTELRSHSSRNIKPVGISRYHEENLSDKVIVNESNLNANRKSDEMADAGNSTNSGNQKSLQILYTGPLQNEESLTTTRQKIMLQVIPAVEDDSTLHGGLMEADLNLHTVDQAQGEEEKVKHLKAITTMKKNKIRGYKLIPASKFTGKSSSHKNVMTLAAVGAGMIPATMALLVPMALGRRKRSLPTLQSLNKLYRRAESRQ